MDVILNIDLENFRYSLIGDGYLKEEVLTMSDEELVLILKQRIYGHISKEFQRSIDFGYVYD